MKLFRAISAGARDARLAPRAATTATWEMNTYQDFLKGRFQGISLDRDGRLTLAPKLETVFSSGQPAIWSIARGAGWIHLRRHRPSRARVSDHSSGASNLVWTSDQPEVFAVAVDAAGVLYAATSPDGKVYRIEKGKATEFFAPKAKYIWSLAFAKDGSLFVGAGDPGNIYRVDKTGKAETYYETGQSHVTALAFDSHGNVLAGTEPNGILYRISAKDKAFVLYNANLPEIRSIVPMPDGTMYAAALGRLHRQSQRTANHRASSPSRASRSPRPPPSITVTDSADSQAETEIKPKAGAARPPPRQPVQQVASGQSTDRDSRRRKIGRLQDQSRRHGGDAVELQGRERLQHGWRSPNGIAVFRHRRRRAASTGWARIARRR